MGDFTDVTLAIAKAKEELRKKREQERANAGSGTKNSEPQLENLAPEKGDAAAAELFTSKPPQLQSETLLLYKSMPYSGLKVAKRKRTIDDPISSIVSSSERPNLPKKQRQNALNGSKEKDSVADPDEETGNTRRNAPSKKPPRSKEKAVYEMRQAVNTRVAAHSSAWYENIDTKATNIPRGDLSNIQYLFDLLKRCISSGHENSAKHEVNLNELRTRIHAMEFYAFLTPALVKRSRVLETQGFPRIFDPAPDDSIEFPWDIKADAESLYIRWIAGDLDPHLLRGITTTKGKINGKTRTSHSIDQAWPHKKSSNVIGHNNLVNGQWWPLRICALRDGAHGEQEAGIYGHVGSGAIAVAVAEGGYSDEDKGSTLEYCGTASSTDTPTKSTQLMMESRRNKNPVRVLRAKNSKSIYSPQGGIRYDGLYEVTGQTLLDPKTAMYRFTLVRQEGQEPIRYNDVGARPSATELSEMAKIRSILSGYA